MDERLRFVARLLDGEEDGPTLPGVRYLAQDWLQMIFNRYKDIGLDGLTDRTRRPMRYGQSTAVSD